LKNCIRTDGVTQLSEFPDPDAEDEEYDSEEEDDDQEQKEEVIITETKDSNEETKLDVSS